MAVVVVATPSLLSASAASGDIDVAVGACVLTLQVTGNYGLAPPEPSVPPAPQPPPTTLQITGEGDCTVNNEMNVPMTVNGSVKTPGDVATWSCLGGVASGQVRFEAATSKFAFVAGATTAVAAAGVGISVTAADDDPSFAASGQFALDTESATDCPPDANTPVTWCGVLEFTASEVVLPPDQR